MVILVLENFLTCSSCKVDISHSWRISYKFNRLASLKAALLSKNIKNYTLFRRNYELNAPRNTTISKKLHRAINHSRSCIRKIVVNWSHREPAWQLSKVSPFFFAYEGKTLHFFPCCSRYFPVSKCSHRENLPIHTRLLRVTCLWSSFGVRKCKARDKKSERCEIDDRAN